MLLQSLLALPRAARGQMGADRPQADVGKHLTCALRLWPQETGRGRRYQAAGKMLLVCDQAGTHQG